MKKLLEIGQIVKTQGIKGELKLIPYVDKLSGFKSLKTCIVDGITKEIARVRYDGSGVFLLFKDVVDRNQAELFRNKIVAIPMECAEPFRDGYFVVELEGLGVYVGDKKVGVLKQILKTGSVDVFEIEGAKPFMVPYLKRLVLNVDIDNQTITFDPIVFEEVVCYED